MIVVLSWLATLTLVTVLTAYFVAKDRVSGYALLVAFYAVYLAAAQILAPRIIKIGPIFAPGATLIFPFIVQVIDMINEVYGKSKAQMAIWFTFATQVLLVLFIILVRHIEPAPFFPYEEAWRAIFHLSIRVTGASWLAFLTANFIDTYVFAFLKKHFGPRLVLRSVFSDKISLAVDTVLFATAAFLGVMPVTPLIIGQMIAKLGVSLLDTTWLVLYKKLLIRWTNNVS